MSASQELYIKTKYVFFLLYLSGVIYCLFKFYTVNLTEYFFI